MEGLFKWEDKLIGRKLRIVTDHKALEFLEGLDRPNPRQIRWYEFLSRFDKTITYIPGKLNKVADCLSRYHENDTLDDITEEFDYVNADLRLDPQGEDLPFSRLIELRAARVLRRSSRLANKQVTVEKTPTVLREPVEERDILSAQYAAHRPTINTDTRIDTEDNPSLGESLSTGPSLRSWAEADDGFIKAIQSGYKEDPTFRKILEQPIQHRAFTMRDGLIYSKNRLDEETERIPRLVIWDLSARRNTYGDGFGGLRCARTLTSFHADSVGSMVLIGHGFLWTLSSVEWTVPQTWH
ncbi:hypothetical protein VTO73DRAFT_4839 [Trametes versicolor]